MPANREINNHEHSKEETLVLDQKKEKYTRGFANETLSSKSALGSPSLSITHAPLVVPSFSPNYYDTTSHATVKTPRLHPRDPSIKALMTR